MVGSGAGAETEWTWEPPNRKAPAGRDRRLGRRGPRYLSPGHRGTFRLLRAPRRCRWTPPAANVGWHRGTLPRPFVDGVFCALFFVPSRGRKGIDHDYRGDDRSCRSATQAVAQEGLQRHPAVGEMSIWATTLALSRAGQSARPRRRTSSASLTCMPSPCLRTPRSLRTRRGSMSAMLLAAGIDPARSTLFVQSHVTAHAEACWILNCVTPVGWLERMTQYKDKTARQDSVTTGLLDYPVLMAGDILPVRRGRGTGRRRPAPARRARTRHRPAVQPPLWRNLRRPGGHDPAGGRSGNGAGRPER